MDHIRELPLHITRLRSWGGTSSEIQSSWDLPRRCRRSYAWNLDSRSVQARDVDETPGSVMVPTGGCKRRVHLPDIAEHHLRFSSGRSHAPDKHFIMPYGSRGHLQPRPHRRTPCFHYCSPLIIFDRLLRMAVGPAVGPGVLSPTLINPGPR